MEVHLGSSELRGTDGTLVIDGHEQIKLEIGEHDGVLLVTMDLYDEQRTHVAKLRKNIWTFHHGDRFDARAGLDPQSGARTFGIRDRTTGEVVLDGAAFTNPRVVIIDRAHFRTITGRLVKIDENGDILLDGTTIRRVLLVGTGPIVLSDAGLGLGV